MVRVLVTGAAGIVGSVLREGLGEGYELRGLDRRRAPGVRRGDVCRPWTISRAVAGTDAIVDLATGSAVSLPWRSVRRDVGGRIAVLEAARRHGVPRYVFASSNHVVGGYEREPPYARICAGDYAGLDPAEIPAIGTDWPVRPDSPYAVGKLFVEAAARLYAEEHGLSCLCLRLGTVLPGDRPTRPRHFATQLTHADLVRLVDCALRAPDDLRFGVYFGVSANTWRFWEIAGARRELGYEPRDDAERFRAPAASATRPSPREGAPPSR